MADNQKFQKLHLEDALEDNPQMRQMLNLFEKDTNMLKKYMKAFLGSCQKIANAQAMMVSASQELSYYLKLYEKQNFPLEVIEDNLLISQLNQFSTYMDEISSWYQVFNTQLNETMIGPLNSFIETEFDDLYAQSELFNMVSNEEEAITMKYLKVPNKKEYEHQRQQANEEVFLFKRKFHNTALGYYASLNSLQLKRKYVLLEPMSALIHGMKLFFKMGSESFSSTANLSEFLNGVGDHIHNAKDTLNDEITKTTQLVDLLQQNPTIYYAESEHTELNENSLISGDLNYKSGNLNLRTKYPFISKWDRYFFFTQNGSLMYQQKTDIVGTSLIDLKSDLVITPIECDDRRFVFQIQSIATKKTIVLQANGERDQIEWLKILNNIVKDDSRVKISQYMSSSSAGALNASTSATSSTSSMNNKIESKTSNISFDLPFSNKKSPQKLKKETELSEKFEMRFLGSMSVNADKGNQYIHETIRSIMAERAKKDKFKMQQLSVEITEKSLNLLDKSSDEVYEFNLKNIAFWSTHNENNRLFGFIVKDEKNFMKFFCHVFECDFDASATICKSIDKATQIAFKKLLDQNKFGTLKKLRETEKKILLQNINSLPDKEDGGGGDVAKSAFNSPNPNFFILENNDIQDELLNDEKEEENSESEA